MIGPLPGWPLYWPRYTTDVALYWNESTGATTDSGSVKRLGLDGSTSTLVSGRPPDPRASTTSSLLTVGLDDNFVYWAEKRAAPGDPTTGGTSWAIVRVPRDDDPTKLRLPEYDP